MAAPLLPDSTVAFVGLGNMGLPMLARLAAAGYGVRATDVSAQARARAEAIPGVEVVADAPTAATGADAVILMLPTSAIVRAVLIDAGTLEATGPNTLIVDMSSSEPMATRELAAIAAQAGSTMIDAPVSGGVVGADAGTLTIMLGGPEAACEQFMPAAKILGRSVLRVGDAGAGHALKALNNLLSAAHLLATSEAVEIGRRFGLDPAVMVEAINSSSGRSGSTDHKFPSFILPETYNSGFPLALMLKDVGIAVDLGEQLGLALPSAAETLAHWRQAADDLPADADHTDIDRWVRRTER